MSFVREMLRRGDTEDGGIRDIMWTVDNTGRIVAKDEKVMATLIKKHAVHNTGAVLKWEKAKVDEDFRLKHEFEIWVQRVDDASYDVVDIMAVSEETGRWIVERVKGHIDDRYPID